MRQKNILITGATGFIGSRILEKLIDENYSVFILLRKTSNAWRINHLKHKYKFFYYETRDNLIDFYKENRIDVIIHLATEYGRDGKIAEVLKSNVILPVELIEIGIKYGLKRFINTDTFSSKPLISPQKLKSYNDSKKILRNLLLDFSEKLKVDNLILEHPFGEKDAENKFVTNLIRNLLLNKPEVLLTAGIQKRDFIYISDVVDAFVAVLKNEKQTIGFDEYEVGCGKSTSVREFVEIVAKLTNSSSKLMFGSIPTDLDEIQNSLASNSSLLKLGWNPKVELEEAIKHTIDYEKLKIKNQ
jgi:nucleoside-diphosphate-sugar epimerase